VVVVRDFDDGYRRWRSSSAHKSLFGEGLPGEIEPFSFVPMEGLRLVAGLLQLPAGKTLVDLGCGRGGPGMWLAQQADAGLVGVDASAVALGDARQRLRLFPGLRSALFEVAYVTATGLVDECADAVVSIDVLQLVDEPLRLVSEARRLLRPGARLVITTWEGSPGAPSRFPRDLPGLLAEAGLEADTLLERPDWLARQLGIYRAAAAMADDGDGDPAIADLIKEARGWEQWHDQTRRVVVAGRRYNGGDRPPAAAVSGFPPAPPLDGQRVWLDPLRVEHAEELAPLLDDPELHTFIGGRPATLAELRGRYRRQVADHSPDRIQRWLNWTVRHRSDGRPVGTVQATVTSDTAALNAEVSWVIAAPHQRQGFAHEAADVMLSWLRRQGVQRIVAHIHPHHQASQRVARKIGLSPTHAIQDGETRWEG